MSVCLSVCSSVYLFINLSTYRSICLSVSVSLCPLYACGCLSPCHSATKWGSGSIKVWQRRHRGIFECEMSETEYLSAGEKQGEKHKLMGWEKWNEAGGEKTALRGTSVCYEPQPDNTDAGCSLHQPAFHHRDFHLNRTLICNTTILAYIPRYITLHAKSWPQSAKQPLSLWYQLYTRYNHWSVSSTRE